MKKTLPEMSDGWALFLDVDGTLLDIAPRPDAVVVPDGLRVLLQRLHDGLDRAVALVSGRSISDLDRLFSPMRLPAAGQHGGELRRQADGEIVRRHRSPHLAAIVGFLREFVAARPALLIEDKGLCVAVHYRSAPEHHDELRRFLSARIAEAGGDLELQPAKMAFEIKPRAVNKGHAVESFMATPPFRGRLPVFIGDDQTDEDGFAAVARLSGHSIAVGRDGGGSARWHIPTAADLRDWLGAFVARLVAP